MNRPRRILFLVSSLQRGGGERVAAALCNAWVGEKCEVYLVPTYLKDTAGAYELSRDVKVVQLKDYIPAPLRILGPIAKVNALRQVVSSLAPDVVISFFTNVNVLAIAALRLLRRRPRLIICERVDIAASIELPWILNLARRVLYRFADALVVQTPLAAKRYTGAIPELPRIAVIPNPLPRALQDVQVNTSRSNVGGGRIVALGRFVPQKQFDLLIRIFAKAFACDPAWRLAIYGEGPLRNELEALIVELGLRERVRLERRTSDPWSVMADAQIFALTSAYEGFPNAMMEAMALGLPSVAFDCPTGPRELSQEGAAAVIVRADDTEAYAAELRKLADDPERRNRLSRVAAESVRARYAEHTILEQWRTLFVELESP